MKHEFITAWSLAEGREKQIFCLSSNNRVPYKVRIFISKNSISWPNPMFDHLLESSHRDDSNKLSNIGFGEK